MVDNEIPMPAGAGAEASTETLRVISLNCWGLKYISKHRHARLHQIGHQLAIASPSPSIVGLQECWTQQDYLTIRDLTSHILPYGKFYWSGAFGGGLAILSRWPIEESNMYRYPLNGRPAAFYRGDWFVGKGVACARIRMGPNPKDVVEVFCTHLHAPYEPERSDSYICHRTAQAWEIAKLMRHAAERGHAVLGLGDFNMTPLSLAHRLIEGHSPVRDVWRILKPDSALGNRATALEVARGNPVPTAKQCLVEHGATCDSCFNTWRWSKQMQKDLFRGKNRIVDPSQLDPSAKRLDYIFLAPSQNLPWRVQEASVGMDMRHPKLQCSLSDHFSVEATLVRDSSSAPSKREAAAMVSYVSLETYDTILEMLRTYNVREERQRRYRLIHFIVQTVVAIGCLVAVWFVPRNFVAFILMLISTLGFSAGIVDMLQAVIFFPWEIRALKEFEFEIRLAKDQAETALEKDV